MEDFELKQIIEAECRKIDPKTRRYQTWAKIGAKYKGVSKALLWKIANIEGYQVKNNKARIALGLSPLIPVPACPLPGCTEPYIHLHGRQTFDPAVQTVTKKRKPRRYKDLWDTPVAVLRWQLDNRLEVPEC